MKKTCLCCGFKTIESDIHDICPICFWQDDPAAWDNPDFVGGANGPVSLRQAQWNFINFGACEKAMLNDVREPTPQDERDPNWKPVSRTIKVKSKDNIIDEVEEEIAKHQNLEKENFDDGKEKGAQENWKYLKQLTQYSRDDVLKALELMGVGTTERKQQSYNISVKVQQHLIQYAERMKLTQSDLVELAIMDLLARYDMSEKD